MSFLIFKTLLNLEFILKYNSECIQNFFLFFWCYRSNWGLVP